MKQKHETGLVRWKILLRRRMLVACVEVHYVRAFDQSLTFLTM